MRSSVTHPMPGPTIRHVGGAEWAAASSPSLSGALSQALAVTVRSLWTAAECEALSASVLAARDRWTSDFGGEQFSLGRAFYTHLETGRSAGYFSAVTRSDATVEAVLPGLQSRVGGLFAAMVAGRVRQRPGFCGPGVHVFPSGSKVARRGGVPHWDVEGLAPEHLARGRRALTLVVMLQAPTRGGGLKLWNARWKGDHEPTPGDLAADALRIAYRDGDAVLIESYRLHRILPFGGPRDRVSITAHGVEVDADVWELWF